MARNLKTKPIIIDKWNSTNAIDYTDTILKQFDSVLHNYNTITEMSLSIWDNLSNSIGPYWLSSHFLSNNYQNDQCSFHYRNYDGKTMKYYIIFHHGNLGFIIYKF